MRFFFSVLLLAAVIVLGAAVVIHMELLDRLPTLLLAIVIFFGLVLQMRQSRLQQELKALRADARGIGDFEQDIGRRLTSIEQSLSKSIRHAEDDSLDRTENVVRQLAVLGKGFDTKDDENEDASEEPPKITLSPPLDLETDQNGGIEPVIRRSDSGVVASYSALEQIDVGAALSNDGLSMHLQPIVELPTRKPLHYEAFMRLRVKDGDFLDAGQFLSRAETGGLMPTIDKKVIFSAVRMLRRLEVLKKRAGLFCNISGDTLADARTFGEISAFLQANSALSNSLVLEISQRHFDVLQGSERDRLMQLADLGYKFSLDQVSNLDIDIGKLKKNGVTFVKMPVSALIENNLSEGGVSTAAALVAALLEEDIRLIATKVEVERDVIALIDLGVEAAQGNVFARPRAVKASLLEKPEDEPSGPLLSISKLDHKSAADEQVSA